MPASSSSGSQPLEAATASFYLDALDALKRDGVPFLVGGAYAFQRFTGVERHTKDFDVFVRPADAPRALAALAQLGLRTEMTFEHWLGKAWRGEDYVDVIFGSGNGAAPVDDVWFEHAVEGTVLGTPVQLVPPEEMIWSKAYIMERERFDGADVLHVIRARGTSMDWDRLAKRFEAHPAVLLAHLVLFGFVYPDARGVVPRRLMESLWRRSRTVPDADDRVCYGTVLSRLQYLTDLTVWGYRDARLMGGGNMTGDQVAEWTRAGLEEHPM